ncbi:hypothetical protein FKR81_19775 [Lentzea tibetensis]|uniref:Uncharacterized protein n=1 Tax=Lentzea tibetensis TaxID=2591470 RepID=A0A563ERY5_9PSEU|nr:hypothetical protein [Lentzea tibetensis]TWP50419.1 hypothetical protein FKR81_19775 [Lentzea tibetensis]
MKVVLGVVLIMGGMVAPAAAAGPCNAKPARSTTGGVMVGITCSSPTAFIDGFGDNASDANREALLLRRFQVTVGPTCSGTRSRTATGGFELGMTCSGPTNFITAYGTTLSAAAAEARLLEAMAPGRQCTDTFVNKVSGGFQVKGHCTSPTVFFSGIGTTVTAAAENARLSSGVG